MSGRHAAPKQPLPGVSRRTVVTLALSGTLGTGALVTASQTAHAASTSTVWDKLAQCESSGNFTNRDTGHNGHFGGFQFSPATWASVGGRGNPADASVTEQLKRAKILLARSGPGQWECKVGLTKAFGAAQGLTVLGSVIEKAPVQEIVPNRVAARAVAFAKAQLGKPYVFGAEGPNSFDCSGLTQSAWKAAGVSIPRTSQAQAAGLVRVARSEIQPGDLVIFKADNGHVAIYIGGGKIIEASRPGTPVRTASLSTSWYQDHFRMVVRPKGILHVPAVIPTTPHAPGAGETAPVHPTPTTTAKVHVVVPGDTLSGIASGAGIKGGWPALYKANITVVGHDPDLIMPGQRIVLG